MMARTHRYEGSAADMADDRKMAKKRGMTLKAWEASAEDEARDKKKQAEMDRKHEQRGVSHEIGVRAAESAGERRHMREHPDHHFAFKRPLSKA